MTNLNSAQTAALTRIAEGTVLSHTPNLHTGFTYYTVEGWSCSDYPTETFDFLVSEGFARRVSPSAKGTRIIANGKGKAVLGL
jgi:hypothetical protein